MGKEQMRKEKGKQWDRLQERLKKKQKKPKSLNGSEGLDKGGGEKTSPGSSCKVHRISRRKFAL